MGYLFFGAADVWAVSVPQISSVTSRWQRTWRYWRARLQNLLPILLTLLLGWSVLVLWQLEGEFDTLALWATFVLTLGLIIRQGLVFGEMEYRQYAGLVNSIAEPTFICDRRGFLRLVNPAFCRAVGLEHERDILGKSLLTWFTPAETLSSWLQRAFEVEDGIENAWAGETYLLREDGERIPVYLSLRAIASGERERLALAGAVHDLSLQKAQQAALQAVLEQIAADRAQLERLNTELEQRVAEKTADLSAAYARLEAQNRALRELDRLKSEFVSLVSHELRAPLTNIKGGLELVLRRPQALSTTTRQRLELVQAEIERLARFVESILDLSALEAGRMPLYPAPVLLGGVVARLQRLLAHHPRAERIVWGVPPDLPPLLADEQALGSILFHLLDNALKYAPDGEISVEAVVEKEYVVLRVMDEGPGIPEHALPFLFEQFYRVDSTDARETYGHGLGLYIVRRLAEAMNGMAWAENRPTGGACFACRLPLAEGTPPATSAASGEGEHEGQDPGRG
jgi:PAS domain S-box-containing protein